MAKLTKRERDPVGFTQATLHYNEVEGVLVALPSVIFRVLLESNPAAVFLAVSEKLSGL
jgi:hypothetical protein